MRNEQQKRANESKEESGTKVKPPLQCEAMSRASFLSNRGLVSLEPGLELKSV